MRLELWIREGMVSMNSGCPPVSTICTMKFFSEPSTVWTKLIMAWVA